ncbi:Putative amino-acid ABC transporter-binding protein YhdW [Seminavis robusta]|uniref:Amino-acid ABC transporter-binding protein YhdW n=1 Tax=Seminavis robusta TaxID=568900 RepID=A0A9N8EXJ5_9STRA|nr:Putative amino-acid ABC transporter-binding protein YhdW [Seminavis robusta]|eukprot:Sro2358_g324660.1 Putative amino-acid ABC transporter-binding protein YhdW (832) ;mRNA; r:4249-6914
MDPKLEAEKQQLQALPMTAGSEKDALDATNTNDYTPEMDSSATTRDTRPVAKGGMSWLSDASATKRRLENVTEDACIRLSQDMQLSTLKPVATSKTDPDTEASMEMPARMAKEDFIGEQTDTGISPLPSEDLSNRLRWSGNSNPGAFAIDGIGGECATVLTTDDTVAAGNHDELEEASPSPSPDPIGETLVIAELAVDRDDELEAKEKENQELRAELQRLAAGVPVAQGVVDLEMGDTIPAKEQEANEYNGSSGWGGKMLKLVGFVLVVALVSAVLAAIAASKTNKDREAGGRSILGLQPVLETIRKNGVVRCRAETFEVKQGFGFTIDLCHALAAAIFDDASKVTFPIIQFRQQFAAIANGTVDVSTTLNTNNMERDVYHMESGHGFTFSDPFYFSQMTFGGIPEYVDCVDREDSFEGICRDLQICVIAHTTGQDTLDKFMPGSAQLLVENGVAVVENFANGNCNVMTGVYVEINEKRIRENGYTGEYKFSERGSWSSEPLAMITRQSDAEWSDFVNLILRSLIAADALNITQETARMFPKSNRFGEDYRDMFIRAIGAVGNYGEIYARHYEEKVPRSGMNRISVNGDPELGGVLYANPFGDLLIDESLQQHVLPGPIENGTMEAVRERGHLRCGLASERKGFAEYNETSGLWSGLDIEFCKAIAASMFAGRVDGVVQYWNSKNDTTAQLKALSDGHVDVLVGGYVRLSWLEANQKLTFSPAYFFESDGAGRTMMTSKQDPQWSDLVRWVHQGTIYAESSGIARGNAAEMPPVELFGSQYRQLFRDMIRATGNYKEMYMGTLEQHIPRQGRNLLSTGNDPGLIVNSFDEA